MGVCVLSLIFIVIANLTLFLAIIASFLSARQYKKG
jgi:hypothetical protein